MLHWFQHHHNLTHTLASGLATQEKIELDSSHEHAFVATMAAMRKTHQLGINLSRTPALHYSRTPVPHPLPREPVPMVDIDLPMPTDSPAVNMGMLLPVNERAIPTFPNLGLGLETPFYPHPNLDLLIPLHSLYRHWLKTDMPVVLFLTPSEIGIPYSAEVCRRSALRYLASVRDRAQLIVNLTSIRTTLEIVINNHPAQRRIAHAMAMPAEIENRILADLSSGKVLFSPVCVEWLLAETVTAEQPPWGVPSKIDGCDDLEKLFFPSLAYGHPASESQDLRAILFAQQGFFHGDRPFAEPATDALLTEMVAGMLASGDSRPLRHISVSAHIWRARRSSTAGYKWRHSMLKTFERATGLTYQRFLALILLACMDITKTVGDLSDNPPTFAKPDIIERLNLFSSDELASFESLIDNYMSISESELRSILRDGGNYRGWGYLESRSLDVLDIPPFIRINGQFVLLGLGRLVRSARTLMFTVLSENGHKSPRGLYGKFCFETTIIELANQLIPRHLVASDDDMEPILGKSHSKPDLLIAHNRQALVVEVYANSIDGRVRKGDHSAIFGRYSRYRSKLKQARAVVEDISTLTSELFNWSKVERVVELVVVEDMSPNNPILEVILKQKGHEHTKIACSIDEFLGLIALGHRGWSVPEIVVGWQKGPYNGPLGLYLQRYETISSVSQWFDKYEVDLLAELFN